MRRLVRIMVVDPDTRLKPGQSLLYLSEKPFMTDADSDELRSEINMKALLEEHNRLRGTIEDKSESRKFEKQVFLEDDLEIRDLVFHVIVEAEVG